MRGCLRSGRRSSGHPSTTCRTGPSGGRTRAANATPAQAQAYPTATFWGQYCNAVVKGKITWYNRTAAFEGIIKSAGECRKVCLEVWNAGDLDSWMSYPACSGDSLTFYHDKTTDLAGGWLSARLAITDGSGIALAWDRCGRPYAKCWDGYDWRRAWRRRAAPAK